jgi:hypothetical protein
MTGARSAWNFLPCKLDIGAFLSRWAAWAVACMRPIRAGHPGSARSCRRGTQLAALYDVRFGRYTPRQFNRRSHGQIHL